MNSYSPIDQFWPGLFLSLQPAAHCHQLKRNAVGNAYPSLNTCRPSTGLMCICHPWGWMRREGKTVTGIYSCESTTSLCSYQLTVTPSLFEGEHTHWCYQWFTRAPTTIKGLEIGNGYFQQLPDVSGDSGAKQLSQVSKKIVRRKYGNEKLLIFLLKLQGVIMVA